MFFFKFPNTIFPCYFFLIHNHFIMNNSSLKKDNKKKQQKKHFTNKSKQYTYCINVISQNLFNKCDKTF